MKQSYFFEDTLVYGVRWGIWWEDSFKYGVALSALIS
jgi:hypothetical protein